MVSPNKIIITVDKRFNDEIDFNGGKLWMDTSFKPEWNTYPYGTVVAAPLRNPNIPQSDFVYNVQAGDRLYVNYVTLMDMENRIVHDGKEYWIVDYFLALATVRDGKVRPVGSYVLIEPIVEEVTHDTLIIPEIANKKVLTKGKVYASNDPEIVEGSTVWFESIGMFENEIEGKKLFVMENSRILCAEKI